MATECSHAGQCANPLGAKICTNGEWLAGRARRPRVDQSFDDSPDAAASAAEPARIWLGG